MHAFECHLQLARGLIAQVPASSLSAFKNDALEARRDSLGLCVAGRSGRPGCRIAPINSIPCVCGNGRSSCGHFIQHGAGQRRRRLRGSPRNCPLNCSRGHLYGSVPDVTSETAVMLCVRLLSRVGLS